MNARAAALLPVLLLAASPAAAQADSRGFVRGAGGVTFVTETAVVLGGAVGFRVHDRVQVFGEAGRLTNVLPRHLQRDLDEAARMLGSTFGGPLSIDGRAPGVYGIAGVRIEAPATGRAALFGEAGVGAARGTSDIRARAGSVDVSESVVRALSIKESESAPAVAFGGGIAVPVTRRLGVDIGYRFMRIFIDDPRINFSDVHVALRWGF
jgi:opacity protein-like surface antigen